jgi:Putative peptidoglycan binding domain
VAVPYARKLRYVRPMQRGDDVRAIQRALRKAKIRKRLATGNYGEATEQQIREFQRRRGLQRSGAYTVETHRELVRFMENEVRLQYKSYIVKRVCLDAVSRRSTIHYHQHRPMTDMGVWPNVPNSMDCSTLTTWAFKSAGLADPNGFGYNGFGNTGSQVVHGRRVSSISQAVPGRSLVFYGVGVTHVALLVDDTHVVSHGSEPGPLYLPWNYRGDIHSIRVYG